ncbi:MAG TPA: hypothetical protein V6C89_10645 [Drouetiella sp.]
MFDGEDHGDICDGEDDGDIFDASNGSSTPSATPSTTASATDKMDARPARTQGIEQLG